MRWLPGRSYCFRRSSSSSACSKEKKAKSENPGGEAQESIKCPRENLMRVQFERDQSRHRAGAKCCQNPRPHRHGGAMFEDAQHIKEETRTSQIHDQQKRREDRAGDGREPHGCAREVDMMKQDRAKRDYRRHPGNSAEEKIERNLPCPDRRFHHRVTVVARFSRHWPTHNVDAATGNDSLLPGFLA